MLTTIARFEIRYLLRNPLLWLTALATFAMLFAGMTVDGFELGSEGGLLMNAAYATLRNYTLVSVFFMFVTTAFVANAVHRDDETGFGPIMHATRITKFEYLMGRFLGAFAIAALCMLLAPLATIAGTLVPWANPAHLGPNRIADHLYAYFLVALPNLFIHSAIFFALATITRSMMATYLGVITFISGFVLLQGSFADQPHLRAAVTMLDPFGARALSDATRYWTVPERNGKLPDFSGALLYNRLLWVGIAIAFLIVAYATYRAANGGRASARPRRERRVEGPPASVPFRTLPSPQRGNAATRALLWMRTRFEMKQVLVSPAFAVLMAWGLFTTIFVLMTQRDPEGRPRYPATLLLIPKIEDAFALIPLVIAIYYAGELVWRERDRCVHELVDASPIPNWAYVISKTAAMALVLLAILVINVVAGITLQLSLGYTQIELGKYLLWYVLPATWDMLLVAALAIFIQAISPHKAIGWGLMVLFVIWQQFSPSPHNLLNYGGVPSMPLSDINGLGSFWKGPWTYRLYWGAFAVLLLLGAHLLWRRGTQTRRGRLTGAPAWIAAAAVAIFVGTGAYAYYNTNVVNRYQSKAELERWSVAFERKYGRYLDLPQPTVAHMTLNVALDPEHRKATTTGSYLLRNNTPSPITDVHVRIIDGDLELTRAALAGAQLIADDREYDYRIYRFARPMQPGEERVLAFETQRWQRGFPNLGPNTRLIENGTFLDNFEVAPVIGMNLAGMLQDPELRRKHGLPELKRPKLEDLAATRKVNPRRGWTKADITVSTTAGQTPIAPGRKILDVTRGGRRIARFVSEAPINPVFSIQSARYAEKHRRHTGVDLAVYYHPSHPQNVDRMLDALEVSLDYYQAHFGPYQFSHVRIVEFPGYRAYAQAFAGTVPYSETYGFLADFHQPETLDFVSGTTAHELAHQYWPHQVAAADMEGQAVLSETLAQYSAMMVLKKTRGEEHIRRHLQYELNRYLEGREYAPANEPSLARAGGQNWILYHKGSLVMYLLQKRLGEESVNRALRNLLHRFKFKGAPYARSLDLVDALRAEARSEEEQGLITDLFERVTLYDLKVDAPAAVRRADGKWDVTVPIEAKKLYADDQGGEAEAPLHEGMEVGLFTAEPGFDAFDAKDVVLMERRPVHSGRQVLHFVTNRRPLYAGVDPYNFYIDREPADNVVKVTANQ